MNSRSKLALRAGAAAFFLSFTARCGTAQPSSDQSPVSTEGQASTEVSSTPSGAVAGAAAAGRGAQPPAAEQGKAIASPSVPTATTTQSVGAAGSSNAAGSGSAAGRSAADGGATAAIQSGAGGSTASGAGGSAGSGSAALPVTMMAWPPVTDFSMKGAFTSVTESNTGPMNAYTLFYPEERGRDGLKHPSLTWGNGATTTPNLFSLLPLLASHGFVVIAANNSFVTSAEMKSGLDWLMEENQREDSMLYQKLDPTKVAALGYSLGSMGAFEMADDPRLTTTVHISGGAMDKSVLANLHKPAAFFCGDSSDIAYSNCESDFEMVTNVPVFYGVFPGDHLGILGSFANQINSAVASWLRWRLMADVALDSMFVGQDCGLCQDRNWLVKQRALEQAP